MTVKNRRGLLCASDTPAGLLPLAYRCALVYAALCVSPASLSYALQNAQRFRLRHRRLPREVEVDVGSARMTDFNVVGLPDNAVKESRERIKSALRNCGFEFPMGRASRLTWRPPMSARRLCLRFADGAGADRLHGTFLRQNAGPVHVPRRALARRQRATVRGALSAALAAREVGLKSVAVPEANAREAAVVEGVDVFGLEVAPPSGRSGGIRRNRFSRCASMRTSCSPKRRNTPSTCETSMASRPRSGSEVACGGRS